MGTNHLISGLDILQEEKEYWLNKLNTLTGFEELIATDNHSDAYEKREIEIRLDKELLNEINSISKHNELIKYITMVTAFKVLVYQTSNQTEITCLSPVYNMSTEHEDANKWVLLHDILHDDMTCNDALNAVKTTVLDAYKNQHVNLMDILEELELTEFMNNIYQYAFVYDKIHTPQLIDKIICSEYNQITFEIKEDINGLYIKTVYDSNKYSIETIEVLTRAYLQILTNMLQDSKKLIKDIEIIGREDKQLLDLINATDALYPMEKSITNVFDEQVLKNKNKIALKYKGVAITYEELSKKVNKLANYIDSQKSVKQSDFVGIMMDKSIETIAAVLAVLKTGKGYAPIDPEYPISRCKDMIDDAGLVLVISQKKYIDKLNTLQWECQGFKQFLCVDTYAIYDEDESVHNELMNKEVWEYVAENAQDQIAGGAWVSSYTGENISNEEMNEYSENILMKLKPYINKSTKILEIGCSSGLTMFKLAPYVELYYGIDLASKIILKDQEYIGENNITNIKLEALPAHDVDKIEDDEFDIIIINSVIQCFNGHNYLKKVIKKAVGKLKEKGIMFFGDIMDQEKKEALIVSLMTFKNQNKDKNYRTKTNWDVELFLHKDFFRDLEIDMPEINELFFSDKIHTISNELTEFRYDVIVSVDKTNQTKALSIKNKYQHDYSELDNYPEYLQFIDKSIPEGNAYIIYTSGTTGKPKGVVIKHKNVINLILNDKIPYSLSNNDVWTMFHSFSFDFSVWEMYGAILYGGTLILISKDQARDTRTFLKLLKDEKVTVLNQTPRAFYNLITEDMTSNNNELALRYIIFGGDVLDPSRLLRFANKYPNIEMVNMYGITETTVHVTYKKLSSLDMSKGSSNIGKPIPNYRTYIMNSKAKLLPIGMIGELCVGGNGVAAGYLNHSVLTKEKFINNPYNPSEILYKSGDLVKLHSNGEMEYIGRCDRQIKIRGHRIEKGEIERAILSYESILKVVVLDIEVEKNEKQLCAYYVSEQKITVREFKDYLWDKIPDYCIPLYYVQVDEIPLNKNGKINRSKLANPLKNIYSNNEYVEAKSEIEIALVQLWKELLQVENVGINDNFFELGGHSLKATILSARIAKNFNVEVPLNVIFTKNTIKGLAEYIGEARIQDYEQIQKAEYAPYYPMSSVQRRMYYLSETEDSGITYNMPIALEVTGNLDVNKVKGAFETLIMRHESLRTSFHIIDGELIQQIHETVDFEVEYETVNSISNLDKQNIIQNFVRKFELDRAPLLRCKIIKVENGNDLLLIDMYHIISDGISVSIIMNEFKSLYNGERLEYVKLQYKDYSEWLRKRDISEQKEYWLDQFKDGVPSLDIPYDHKRQKVQSFNGSYEETFIDSAISEEIKDICRSTNTTEYMVFLSALMILLSIYSRQDDIIVGSPISGRTHSDMEQIVGMFVNTLVMRAQPQKDKTYLDFLNEVKRTCMQAYKNQEYQFEELVEELHVERDISRNPMFDIMFVMQNFDMPILKFDGITLAPIESKSIVSKFDLSIIVSELEEGYSLSFEYCSDLFNHDSIVYMMSHYVNLLKAILKEPDQLIQNISYLSETERQLMLRGFNNNTTNYPSDFTVVELFEIQSEKTPNNVAVSIAQEKLTYKELNERANHLASWLRENNVGTDCLVPIIVERCTEAIIGILGILKAGGAYVPMEADLPLERLQYMINNCNPNVIITMGEQPNIQTSAKIIDLRTEDSPSYIHTNLSRINKPNDLAYVIYTSGSTGKPKGVMVVHRSIVRLVKSTNYIVFDENTIMLQTGALSFDASTFEIWGPLLSGGTLCLTTKEDILNEISLASIINHKNVNTMWLTSSLFNQMISMDKKIFNQLKILVIGGEKLSEEHVRILIGQNSAVKLINGYGPTENTTFTTTYAIPNEFEIIPIGKPIANTQVYIMDNMMLCGIGVPGELCTTGDGVARGYLNKKELTYEKFIDNPFGKGKMYRSGDLVRWTPDGNIEYFGRIDKQVKIRGFRIELGEIESAILKTNKISQVSVIVRKDNGGENSIYAYIVSEQNVDLSELRKELHTTLPEFMMPAYMTQIDKLPVNKNGKIDIKQLPNIEVKSRSTYLAPRDKLEKTLAMIYSEVLKQKDIGIRDNFFELGGHSLRATKVINRIEAVIGIRLPLKTIFANPTIEELATQLKKSEGHRLKPIPKAENKDYYLMSSTQRRLYIIDKMGDKEITYNMPAAMEVIGDLDYSRVHKVLQCLVLRHEMLRTSFNVVDGELVQKIHDNAEIEMTYREKALILQEDKEALIADYIRPFDLTKAPLMRVEIVKIKEKHYILMFDMHHIISDGMSMNILIKEFSVLYDEGTLDNISVQYKDYSEWLRKRELSGQKDYWINEFSDEIPVLNLPTDYNRPRIQSFNGKTINAILPHDIRLGVERIAKETGSTEYMVLLSAFMILLGKYCRQDDIIVGCPISGRIHKDTEHMLGMFANTLALRGKPITTKRVIEFIDEVKNSCLKAYENQEYTFEELIENVEVRRDLSRNPIFDVMFALQNNDQEEIQIRDMNISYINVESNVSKFDISVNVVANNDEYSIGFEYCTDLFKEDSIRRMLEHYKVLLLKIIDNPQVTIGEINVLTEEEKIMILKEFNNTVADYPKEKTIVDLFEEQVDKSPNNIAVVYKEQHISYHELNEKSNQLARELKSMGIKPNSYVALIVERSIQMIIGIIGILKSGAAYVPIDPTLPIDRINYMLKDCDPKAILTDGNMQEYKISVPCINVFDDANFTGSIENLQRVNKINDLAYLIYTSGTTGKPKGVMVEHQGISNLREYFIKVQGANKNDNVLQFANIAFDASISEITMSLLVGGTLFVLAKDEQNDIHEFENFICNNYITSAILPPLFLAQTKINGLRNIITAGSQTNKQLIVNNAENEKYSNDYGPTEVTVCATHWEWNKSEPIPDRIPIGKPIMNKNIYIMDGQDLCGIGIPGELCIAGIGLARGYLNMLEITEEKFVDNPFGNGKMYHSGDLARWLPDGNIEFLGRIDDQVKIRGFRVELGEVEALIRKTDKVEDVAVIAQNDLRGELCLCAYIVPQKDIHAGDIRQELHKLLPDYMIPAFIFDMEKLPLNKNGKLDKKALPKIKLNNKDSYMTPRNEREEKLVQIFSEVLRVENIGIKDNFFELGGHSLSAMSVINQIEIIMGIRLQINQLFMCPTVESLIKELEAADKPNYKPIPKAVRKEFYLMSTTQKRMYIINQMEDVGVVYNMPVAILMKGNVDYAKVQKVFDIIVSRHDILRTSFHMIDGEPVQKIHNDVKLFVEYKDMKELGIENIEDLLSTFVVPFELSKAPLIRVSLIRISKQKYALLFDMHHIISDGTSINTIIHEFTALYEGADLAEREAQYVDYSEWMLTRDFTKQLAFWKNVLKDDIPVLEMPLDYQRPQTQSFQGGSVSCVIDNDVKKGIATLLKDTNTTEYMLFLAAFMVLLGKYSRQEDIVVGSPISCRIHKDTERMIGMFSNTLVMRGQPKSENTFNKFLLEIRDYCVQAYENQELPFEKIVEIVNVSRDLSRNPIFDVMFTTQDIDTKALSINDIDISFIPYKDTVSKFDISATVSNEENGYFVNFEYCRDLYNEEGMKKMISHYVDMVKEIIKDPNCLIGELSLANAESKQILEEFNNTTRDYSRDMTMIDMFEQQALLNKDSTAIVYNEEILSNGVLNEKANKLAHTLRGVGIKPNDTVAIIIDRSFEMIIGILGILKAGGAYVPMDPRYPLERLEYMIADCKAQVVLTGMSDCQLKTNAKILDITKKEAYSDLIYNPEKINTSKDLAYIIYTSGTTGKPKGVMIEHHSLTNIILNLQHMYPITKGAAYLLKTTFTFDVSLSEIFGWMFNGSKLVILRPGDEINPQIIASTIGENNVTHINFVPSMLRVFLREMKQEDILNLNCLKYIFAAGEALTSDIVSSCKRILPNIELVNLYGPTEATIYATNHTILSADIKGLVPIGKPLTNVKTYVLDKYDNLCAIGIPGELCLAGEGIARGYLNGGELNNDKFVKNPYGDGYIYRTGDLARWLPDGNIEYLGRLDNQVKIRGYRIELGEIESAIRELDFVQDVVVITNDDPNNTKSLYAFIISNDLDITSIKQHLVGKLPSYMVPSYFVRIDKIPITNSGKIDRKQLLQIGVERNKEYIAPTTMLEEKITDIWRNILGVDNIGINDVFFDIGGDSLKAITILGEINRTLHLELNIKDIFRYTTIGLLSRRINEEFTNLEIVEDEFETFEF